MLRAERAEMFLDLVSHYCVIIRYIIRCRKYRIKLFSFTCVSYAEARLSYRLECWTSVCLSVCLSVTRWYCIKTAEHIVMLSSPRDSPFILVLCVSRSSRNSDGITPCGAAKQRWGMKMSQLSTNNLLYLRNG